MPCTNEKQNQGLAMTVMEAMEKMMQGKNRQKKSRAGKVTDEHFQVLQSFIQRKMYKKYTADRCRAAIHKHFGITPADPSALSVETVRKMLHKLGYSWKKLTIRKEVSQQENHVKDQKITSQLLGHYVKRMSKTLVFIDESSICSGSLSAASHYGWAPLGKQGLITLCEEE